MVLVCSVVTVTILADCSLSAPSLLLPPYHHEIRSNSRAPPRSSRNSLAILFVLMQRISPLQTSLAHLELCAAVAEATAEAAQGDYTRVKQSPPLSERRWTYRTGGRPGPAPRRPRQLMAPLTGHAPTTDIRLIGAGGTPAESSKTSLIVALRAVPEFIPAVHRAQSAEKERAACQAALESALHEVRPAALFLVLYWKIENGSFHTPR